MKGLIAIVATMVFVAACGGGGGDSALDETGIVSISLTDATVDNVKEVWVEFAGVTLKPQGGEEITVTFDMPKTINLMDLQNGVTAELLPATTVPAGRYNWVRLAVNAEFDNVHDSYALLDDDSQVELRVPSGSQRGLRLVSGFVVTQNQSTNIVIDWDLRQALSEPLGQPGLHLRPALRVTDLATYGTLVGSVDMALVTDDSCSNDLLEDTGNAVYLYEGEVADPADIRGADTDPLVTATVRKDGEDVYRYAIDFLGPLDYTAAFTCQASDDDADAENDIVFSAVAFPVTIVDGETTQQDFAPPVP